MYIREKKKKKKKKREKNMNTSQLRIGWLDTDPIDISVHSNTIISFHELTRSNNLPQGNPHVLTIVPIVLTHNLLDGSRCLSSVVEWDSGNIVVQDMGLDDVVEDVLTNKAKVSVNGGSCTLSESPFRVIVMWHSWVSVLQESDKDQPVVYPHEWDEPVDESGPKTVSGGPPVDKGKSTKHTDIRENDVPVFLWLKDWRRWIEVGSA
jgi:hypothetical protein